jgi:GH15 family glucan-1,4-alpha-glucosidase
LTDALYQAGTLKRKKQAVLRLLVSLLDHLERIWRRPDHGIWEVRGKTRHFTHSKVMCWVAFDRAIRNVEEMKIRAPLEKWRSLRREIHESVCRRGFNTRLGAFVQAYGSQKVDASLLLLPLVGFLPPEDPRIVGTVRLIEKRLLRDGFAMRRENRDRGSHEGAFLPCSFWLADYYELAKRRAAARGLLKRLLKVRNDVGLLSEEYDPARRRLVGNFPQALSHVALINTIINLYTKRGPSRQRSSSVPRDRPTDDPESSKLNSLRYLVLADVICGRVVQAYCKNLAPFPRRKSTHGPPGRIAVRHLHRKCGPDAIWVPASVLGLGRTRSHRVE